jgi:PKD repeat protein
MDTGTRLAAALAIPVLASAACRDTTTAATPQLAITCTGIPSAGPAPLSVVFGLEVSNAAGTMNVRIDYGDGSQGTDPAARHVYASPGNYAASITVSSGSQSARCSVPIAVAPGTPSPPLENRWPDPSYRTTPAASGSSISGSAPLTVLYNLCRSQDPDGDGLFFRMDLDGDGSWEHFGTTGTDCSQQATYAAGTHSAAVCLTDGYCPAWPLCDDLPRWRYHPYQCMSYELAATP